MTNAWQNSTSSICEDDLDAVTALFTQLFDWARARDLDIVIGPKDFGPLDGYGLLGKGYDQCGLMNMMNYNYAYYHRLV